MLNLSLNNEELQSLTALLDAGVKATGLQSVKPAAALLAKLEAAVAEANKPAPAPQETE
jgi:hypothetical protein